MSDLYVSELFSSFQGEGMNLGMPAVFLRLAGCNLRCRWCDSRYAWSFDTEADKATSVRKVGTAQLAREVAQLLRGMHRRPALVVTGGEPLLQQSALLALIHRLLQVLDGERPPLWLEIETNGTLPPDDDLEPLVDLWTVSPKLDSSVDPRRDPDSALRLDGLEPYVVLSRLHSAVFKFVAGNLDDLAEIDRLVASYHIRPDKVYIMPEGVTAEALGPIWTPVAEAAIAQGYRLTTRLHILLYGGARRGV